MLVGMSKQEETPRARANPRITVEVEPDVYRRLGVYRANSGRNIKDFTGEWIAERLEIEEKRLASS